MDESTGTTPVTDAPVTDGVTDALFPTATEADRAARVTKVTADPAAPFGYMVDPVSGERRPKKAPGRQPGAGRKAATAPPRAARPKAPRTAPPKVIDGTATVADTRSYAERVAELVDSDWMVTAGIPAVDTRVLGVDVGAVTTKVAAQGSILRQHRGSLAQGVGIMAENSPVVAKTVDWLTSGSGAGWILPAVMMLAPFAAQTAALWRGSKESAQVMADQTRAEFRALMTAMGAASGALAGMANAEGGNVDQGAAPVVALA